ncbi:hypothetical protein ABT213_19610 [Streptomyces sp. NPDC001674]|uniref:hypothetical protein n=1 Tax=Streptomyces sp. NPDC001674 TaxID=3154394 RepID=UPI00332C0C42
MHMDDLAWQASNFGGLAPRSVRFLLKHGHLELVIRAAAERDEWFCAEGAVKELCRAGEFGRALTVMEPFVATGWPTAVWAKADILLRAGRSREALDLVRPHEPGGTSKAECHDFAGLLARAGRVDGPSTCSSRTSTDGGPCPSSWRSPKAGTVTSGCWS